MNKAIITQKETKILASAITKSKKEVFVTLNLGKSTERVELGEDFALLRGEQVSLKSLEKTKENTIYVAQNSTLASIDFFSEKTNLFYKLAPTNDWPTVMLSSVPMHRFKTISPKTSAGLMVKSIFPLKGRILDSCTGLGYTSILSAQEKKVDKVITFEKDGNVLRIAEHNPYSEELFFNKKIELRNEDVFFGIKKLENDYFDGVIHDPPTTSFAPDLYTPEFYKELFRVMKNGAMLYHYCPNPGKTKGTEFHPTIIKLLEKAGFVDCAYTKESSGIIARKK